MLVHFKCQFQNPKTIAAVRALLKEGARSELQSCFGARMEFGTAGLRAPMGAGVSRMNDLTIIQTTQVIVNTRHQHHLQQAAYKCYECQRTYRSHFSMYQSSGQSSHVHEYNSVDGTNYYLILSDHSPIIGRLIRSKSNKVGSLLFDHCLFTVLLGEWLKC